MTTLSSHHQNRQATELLHIAVAGQPTPEEVLAENEAQETETLRRITAAVGKVLPDEPCRAWREHRVERTRAGRTIVVIQYAADLLGQTVRAADTVRLHNLAMRAALDEVTRRKLGPTPADFARLSEDAAIYPADHVCNDHDGLG